METREDDISGAEIALLLAEHLEDMHCVTSPGSIRALDLDRHTDDPNSVFMTKRL